jgi:hypothetical protein
MAGFDPSTDAEWMLETIIDDFAQSMTAVSRAQFYAQLAELLAQRRNHEARLASRSDSEPDLPPHVH